MKSLVLVLIAVTTAIKIVSAQTPANSQPDRARESVAASGPIRSPEVSADGRVTFRLRAANAKEVLVGGVTATPIAMQKDAQGNWSVTTPSLKPDLYAYSFLVDGMRLLDPSNPRVRPAYDVMNQSLVLVPGANPWTPRPDVERGAVARHSFHSAVAGDDRDYWVYTPANYDPKRKVPYPVLYLLHGLFDDARAWVEVGAANVVLDNLIAVGRATPMIVVTPLGYGNAEGPAGHLREDMLPNFGRILLEEVMPRVERRYNVSTQQRDRAIAGLSMGGAEAVLIGLNHLDTFAWVGSFSGAYNLWPLTRPASAAPRFVQPPSGPGGALRTGPLELDVAGLPRSFPTLDASANAQIRLLWITCGTADSLIGVNRQFARYLDARGVRVTYTETPDVGHVWLFWRRSLADLLPQLFK